METSGWRSRANAEIEQAEKARSNGNEGMARVCARRAAGIIIGEYLDREGISQTGRSAYARLKILRDLPSLSEEIQEVAGHFLVRINPDHSLPLDVDLIAEVHWLAKTLLHRDIENA